MVTLEYLGVHIEDSGSDKIGNTWTRVTVPEYSTLDLESDKNKETICEVIEDHPYHTQEDLIDIAKIIIREKLPKVRLTEEEFDTLISSQEDIDEWNDFIKETVKIFVKVREGDVWSNDRAEEKLESLFRDLESAKGYVEV